MIPTIFIAILLVLAVFVLCLSYYFGRWKQQPIPVTITHTIGWYIPLLIICILPLDIAATFFEDVNSQVVDLPVSNKSIPLSYVSKRTLNAFWHAVYWTSQILTWFVLPIMQSYAIAGDFTILRKLRTALIDNALYYGSYLVVFGCIFVYLLVKRTIPFDVTALRILLITTSNTWGLFLVVIFLGYGLVEVPRVVWRSGDSNGRLKLAYFQLSKRYLDYIEDEEELLAVIKEVHEMNKCMSSCHALRAQLDTVLKKIADFTCTEQIGKIYTKSHNERQFEDKLLTADTCTSGPGNITLGKLVSVHKRLKKTLHHQRRARSLWIEALHDASWQEDLVDNLKSDQREFQRGIPPFPLLGDSRSYFCSSSLMKYPSLRRFEWYWKCRFRSWILRILGTSLIVSSVLFVWSECTFFIREPVLSIVALGLQWQSRSLNYSLISAVSLASLGYMSLCIYFSAYRLRLFNKYRLVPNHNTDTTSLIFYGTLLCRLTPSLCLNFLGLAHLDSHILPKNLDPRNISTSFDNSTVLRNFSQNPYNSSSYAPFSTVHLERPTLITVETAYTKFMGHLDLIPFIAGGFNIYFPMLIVVFCLFTYFRIGSRIMHYLGIPQLIDTPFKETHKSQDQLEYDIITEDTVNDGKMLLYRERILTRTKNRNKSNDEYLNCQKTSNLLRPASSVGYINQVYESEYTHSDERNSKDASNFGDYFNEPIVEYSEDRLSELLNLNLQPSHSRHHEASVDISGNSGTFPGTTTWSRISRSIHGFFKKSPT